MGAKKLNYSVCIDAVFRESKLSFVELMNFGHGRIKILNV